MGKSRDGKIRKTADVDGEKVNMRFANQHEAYRIGILVDYIHACLKLNPGITYEEVSKMLLTDFDKTLKHIGNIKERLENGKAN